MGTWGVAIFSDDLASDIRDAYVDMLSVGYEDLKAEQDIITEFYPSIRNTREEPIFWIALASIEWKYGRISDFVKSRALEQIENKTDLPYWNERDRNKREKILDELALKLNQSPPERKKVKKPSLSKTDWKKDDIIAFNAEPDSDNKSIVILQVFDIQKEYASNYVKNERYMNEFPIVGVYKWIGENIPSLKELLDRGFVSTEFLLPNGKCGGKIFTDKLVVGNQEYKKFHCRRITTDNSYLKLISEDEVIRQTGIDLCGFEAIVASVKHQCLI